MDKENLSTKLKLVIDALPLGRVEVADIRDLFGQEGLMLLSVILGFSLPGAAY